MKSTASAAPSLKTAETSTSPGPGTARVYRGTPRNLAFLARRLQAGDLVGVPTETVYGLAANALDARASAKIYRAKGRPATDPLIVHVHSMSQLGQVCQPNAAALRLAQVFWPGALTLILPKSGAVPPVVTAGRDSVAVRMPRHPLFRRLLKLTNLPLAAPSANPFGYISPTTAEHVRAGLGTKIRYILDGGPARIGLESTIVDLRDPKRPALLRPGAITAAEVERALGQPLARPAGERSRSASSGQVAPGMLPRHYSPRTPLVLHARLPADATQGGAPDEAFVFLKRPCGSSAANVFWLDAHGDLRGAARRLFATLRALDARTFHRIHVELAPAEGLGAAINDRLRRAATR
jgi:L-threonylcarbamoyladenylate synthase